MSTQEKASNSSQAKPTLIGLYAISGSGKSTLMLKLQKRLEEPDYNFWEGSRNLDHFIPGGLEEFAKMEVEEKQHWRGHAIKSIGTFCAHSGCVGVISGHALLWEDQIVPVHTDADFQTFSHILYLDVPIQKIHEQRQNDSKVRITANPAELEQWQNAEMALLQRKCLKNNIIFARLSGDIEEKAYKMIRDIKLSRDNCNQADAVRSVQEAYGDEKNSSKTMLVLDGDKTLIEEDTGKMFWEKWSGNIPFITDEGTEDPLHTIFASTLLHPEFAFRQIAFLYETLDSDKFLQCCEEVAASVKIRAEFKSLLNQMKANSNVDAMVVTCGLPQIWEKILAREGLDIRCFGSGRFSDGFFVTPKIKADIVRTLQLRNHATVWAFGDSLIDMNMLQQANQAVVVVGPEKTRSRSMDSELNNAIRNGLQAYQVLIPETVRPRLSVKRLPVLQLSKVLPSICDESRFKFIHTTEEPATKLLASTTRDARCQGPALRAAHENIGRYLAITQLSHVIGLEETDIPHVTGGSVTGHRFLKEDKTTIVALMRGGEPMALGVSEEMPCAVFVHAFTPRDLKPDHLKGQATVVLVDSVINTGKSVIEFIEHIRRWYASIKIVVLTAVAQEEVMTGGKFSGYKNVTLVALRVSARKYFGTGNSDTGNRLFNTVHMA